MRFFQFRTTCHNNIKYPAEFQPLDCIELVVEEGLGCDGREQVRHHQGDLGSHQIFAHLHYILNQTQMLMNDETGVWRFGSWLIVSIDILDDPFDIAFELIRAGHL